MTKKNAIISGILVPLVLLIVFIVANSGVKGKISIPDKVFVYFEETNAIKHVRYSEFLACSVGGFLENMDADNMETESLKAVTAAINSRLLFYMSENSSDISSARTSEAFKNYGADFIITSDSAYSSTPNDKIKKISAEFTRAMLTFDGKPVNVPICLISNGRTDAAPYSPSTALPCDIDAEGFKSVWSYTPDEILSALYSSGELSSRCGDWFHDPSYSDTGTLICINFADQKISGTALRNALGLRSTTVTIAYLEDKFTFTCLGLGENRGMSVYAANYYAKHGKNAEDILKIFYPDCTINNIK